MTDLPLALAKRMIQEALAYGGENSLKPLSVVVLDAGGHGKAFERADGASNSRFQIARGKAFGALAFGVGSRALMARAQEQPYFVAALNRTIGGAMIPVPGGVLVVPEGRLVGAAGVTGDSSDNDELAAVAGIDTAGLVAETG